MSKVKIILVFLVVLALITAANLGVYLYFAGFLGINFADTTSVDKFLHANFTAAFGIISGIIGTIVFVFILLWLDERDFKADSVPGFHAPLEF